MKEPEGPPKHVRRIEIRVETADDALTNTIAYMKTDASDPRFLGYALGKAYSEIRDELARKGLI